MQQNQAYYLNHESNKHNWFGLVGTIMFHGLIFIVLYFFVLTPPNPPWADGGTSMILGEENMGGENQTPVENPQKNETFTEIKSQPTPDELSQSTDEVDVIAKKNETKTFVKPTVNNPIDRPKDEVVLPRKADTHSLFKKKSTSTNDGGQGNGTEPGNEGSPDGSPDGILGGTGTGNEGTGTGNGAAGNGVKFSLTGRRVAKKPNISANSKDVGIVVVNITVDRAGNVIKAEPGARGTTTLNADKLREAKNAALSTKFSAKADGPEEQYGTMTVSFTFE
jgi:protein TonB